MDSYDSKQAAGGRKQRGSVQHNISQNLNLPTAHCPLPPVVLVGFMASGKSSVSRELAGLLGCEATDTDSLIEQAAGKSISEIFAQDGEAEFRRLETEQLGTALGRSGVIATGGGIVMRAENRALLQGATQRGVVVIYLKVSAPILARRIRKQPGKRPLIDGDRILNLQETRERVEGILQQREPYYSEVATLTINGGASSPPALARKIADNLFRETKDTSTER